MAVDVHRYGWNVTERNGTVPINVVVDLLLFAGILLTSSSRGRAAQHMWLGMLSYYILAVEDDRSQ